MLVNSRKKLQEETNSSFTLYIVQGRISLYEFKRFYDENKNVFLEKYLEGVGEIRKLDCSQVQELGKEQIVVSSKKKSFHGEYAERAGFPDSYSDAP